MIDLKYRHIIMSIDRLEIRDLVGGTYVCESYNDEQIIQEVINLYEDSKKKHCNIDPKELLSQFNAQFKRPPNEIDYNIIRDMVENMALAYECGCRFIVKLIPKSDISKSELTEEKIIALMKDDRYPFFTDSEDHRYRERYIQDPNDPRNYIDHNDEYVAKYNEPYDLRYTNVDYHVNEKSFNWGVADAGNYYIIEISSSC